MHSALKTNYLVFERFIWSIISEVPEKWWLVLNDTTWSVYMYLSWACWAPFSITTIISIIFSYTKIKLPWIMSGESNKMFNDISFFLCVTQMIYPVYRHVYICRVCAIYKKSSKIRYICKFYHVSLYEGNSFQICDTLRNG